MNKLRIRPAQPWAWLAALSEFVGGLLVAIGLLSPLGSLAIAGAMLVAVATVHLSRGFWAGKGGYEFNLLILASVAALALTGPGVYSIDQLFLIKLPEPLTLAGGHRRGSRRRCGHARLAQTNRATQARNSLNRKQDSVRRTL